MSDEVVDGDYETPAEILMIIAGKEHSMATADLPVTVQDGKVIGLNKVIATFLREMATEVEKSD